MSLTFYYGSGSPYAWKVWLALEHKAIPYDIEVLSFDKGETRAPAFLAINPRGKVPTIVDDGYALWESAAIVEYLDEAYPQRPLLPKDLQGRATVRRIAAEAESYLGVLAADLFRATLFRKGPEDAKALADLHTRLDEELPRFEASTSERNSPLRTLPSTRTYGSSPGSMSGSREGNGAGTSPLGSPSG